jgi:hypothetical protein
MALWGLWLDYHRRDADGLTHGNMRNARPDVTLAPGAHIVVGNQEAEPAVAEVVHIDDDGVILLRVVPGTVEDNRSLLRPLSSRS